MAARVLSETQLREVLDACVRNAEGLVAEAKLLHQYGHFARSLVLAYFATEEVAKTSQLDATIVDVALGWPIDWRIFWCRWSDHEPKSLTASHSETVADAISKRIASGAPLIVGDVAYVVPYDVAVLKRHARAAHQNRLASLYVDWRDNPKSVIDPSSITAAQAAGAIDIAARQSSTARWQLDNLMSSPAEFAAIVEARRTGRAFIKVMQERGLLPPE
jgi:AbiV family abortive infection protein